MGFIDELVKCISKYATLIVSISKRNADTPNDIKHKCTICGDVITTSYTIALPDTHEELIYDVPERHCIDCVEEDLILRDVRYDVKQLTDVPTT